MTDYVVRHPLKCECGEDLTQPESVEVHISADEQEFDRLSSVDENGLLRDMDNLIANGYHAGSCCWGCGEQIDELFNEVDEGVIKRADVRQVLETLSNPHRSYLVRLESAIRQLKVLCPDVPEKKS